MISVFTAIAATIILFWLGRILIPDEPILVAGGALFLGLLIRRFVEKKWRKRHKQTENFDIFPNLRLKALEQWGIQKGQQYKDLKKIVLFDPPLKYPLDVNYILYFDFDTSTSEGKNSEKHFNENNAFQINSILDNGFQEVYRNKVNSDFRDEWFLTIVRYSGFDDDYSWIIYQKDNG
jgi:hypothetical protein